LAANRATDGIAALVMTTAITDNQNAG